MTAGHAARRSLAATCVTLALSYGVWYSYSIFLVALLREFGWSRSLVAGAFSVFALVHGCLSPMLGVLGDRIGPRRVVLTGGVVLSLALVADGAIVQPWHLFVTFGGLTAAGVALAGWVPAVVLVQGWFPERIGLALGIAGSGIGVGIFVVVPLCQILIDALGWRWAFRIVGLLVIAWVVPATLVLVRNAPARPVAPPAAEGPLRRDDARDPTLARVLHTPLFWLLATAQVLGNFCTQMLLVHQAAFLVDHRMPAIVAASVVSVVGVTSIVGKTGGGWLSDSIGREVVYTLGMTLIVTSVGVLGLIALAPAVLLAYLYGALIGMGYSVTASLMPAVAADRFHGRHFGSIFGALQLTNAIGGSTGPWLAGRIFDTTGSYAAAFALAVVAALVAVAALWAARRLPLG